MKFSTRSSYGLRAVVSLAKQSDQKNISLSNIAKSEKISQKYLERIFAQLKTAKIVKSELGTSGGYVLAKKPSELSVFDVINALEEHSSPFHCIKSSEKIYCSSGCSCSATDILTNINEKINSTLKSIKLNEF